MGTRSNAIYASDHILFLRLNTLMPQPFDAKRLELTGEALPIGERVRESELSVFGLFLPQVVVFWPVPRI